VPQSDQQKDKDLAELLERQLLTMDIAFRAKVNRTAATLEEFIEGRLMQGASPDSIQADLEKDLEEGGRIFGEFRNAIRATSNGVINRMRDDTLFSEIGMETKYRWVAVLINTCPDCLDRHGKVKSWEKWEADGLPRTGQTVCKENCKCVLLPEANVEIEPVMRGRK
jgi:hypothetical protein